MWWSHRSHITHGICYSPIVRKPMKKNICYDNDDWRRCFQSPFSLYRSYTYILAHYTIPTHCVWHSDWDRCCRQLSVNVSRLKCFDMFSSVCVCMLRLYGWALWTWCDGQCSPIFIARQFEKYTAHIVCLLCFSQQFLPMFWACSLPHKQARRHTYTHRRRLSTCGETLPFSLTHKQWIERARKNSTALALNTHAKHTHTHKQRRALASLRTHTIRTRTETTQQRIKRKPQNILHWILPIDNTNPCEHSAKIATEQNARRSSISPRTEKNFKKKKKESEHCSHFILFGFLTKCRRRWRARGTQKTKFHFARRHPSVVIRSVVRWA